MRYLKGPYGMPVHRGHLFRYVGPLRVQRLFLQLRTRLDLAGKGLPFPRKADRRRGLSLGGFRLPCAGEEATGISLRKPVLLPMLMVVLALSACSSEFDKLRDKFVDNCVAGGAPKSSCKCAFDKLQEHYGEQGLLAIEKQTIPPSDLSDRLFAAAGQCRNR